MVFDAFVTAVKNDVGYWDNTRGPIVLTSTERYVGATPDGGVDGGYGSPMWKPVAYTYREMAR